MQKSFKPVFFLYTTADTIDMCPVFSFISSTHSHSVSSSPPQPFRLPTFLHISPHTLQTYKQRDGQTSKKNFYLHQLPRSKGFALNYGNVCVFVRVLSLVNVEHIVSASCKLLRTELANPHYFLSLFLCHPSVIQVKSLAFLTYYTSFPFQYYSPICTNLS